MEGFNYGNVKHRGLAMPSLNFAHWLGVAFEPHYITRLISYFVALRIYSKCLKLQAIPGTVKVQHPACWRTSFHPKAVFGN